MEQGLRTAGFSRGKVIRPLLCWFVLSFVLLAWRYHQQQERKATIQFTVSIEGRKGFASYDAKLDQLPFVPGNHSGLGRKELSIRADDADSFTTNLFVGYRGKHLGNVILARSRGTLDLTVKPAAIHVGVDGQEASKRFDNASHESISLPTGRYTVKAQFARFTTEREIEITRHQTSQLVIDPGITALTLNSHPTNAELELNAVALPDISVRSNTPVTITDLPAGEYRLRIWRGDFQKTMSLKLRGDISTNEVPVEFDYGNLAIASEPRGAEIRDGAKVMGTTPLELTLPTGLYHLEVAKQGYFTTNVSLTLRTSETKRVALVLLNRTYVEALEQARDKASQTFADFERALEHVNKALEIKRDDEAALALRRSITFRKHLRDAREFERNREFTKALREIDGALHINANDTSALAMKHEIAKELDSILRARAEARRELPSKVFEQTVTTLPHHDLFPSQKMQFTGELASIRTKIVETLGRNPAWNVRRHDVTDQDVAIIQAEIKGFGSRQNALIVAGQTAEKEVTLYFKLWTYTLGNKIQVGLTTGISEDSYKPLHSSYASEAIMVNLERRRARELDDFKKRLESGLP